MAQHTSIFLLIILINFIYLFSFDQQGIWHCKFQQCQMVTLLEIFWNWNSKQCTRTFVTWLVNVLKILPCALICINKSNLWHGKWLPIIQSKVIIKPSIVLFVAQTLNFSNFDNKVDKLITNVQENMRILTSSGNSDNLFCILKEAESCALLRLPPRLIV